MSPRNPNPDKPNTAKQAPRENSDPDIKQVDVGELETDEVADGSGRIASSLLDRIRVNLSVELGRAELAFRELQSVTQGAVVELDHLVGDPLDIRANGQLIARGEVVSIKDERYGIRVTEVVRRTSDDGDTA